MKPISSTDMPPLEYDISKEETSKKFKVPSNRIGWIHSLSDQPGAKFDITIKDALGRIKVQKLNCGNETERYGELIDLETDFGEEVEVVIDNVKGTKKLNIFIN